MSTNKLSILIINYNSSSFTNKLISTIEFIKDIVSEIVIIDNNSSDIDKLTSGKQIKIFRNKQNLGFAKAVNQGIRIIKSEYILLLNPDTFLIDNSITTIFKSIQNDQKVGAIGGKIINAENGEVSYTATARPNFMTAMFEFTNLKKIFKNNVFSKEFWLESQANIQKETTVETLCGAFLLFRKHINNKLNLFDERYFMYLEDVDFGIKINHEGYKVIFNPTSRIIHYGGRSNNSKYRTVLKYWYESRKKFFLKHSSKIGGLLLYIIFTIEEKMLFLYHKLKNAPNE